MNRLILDNIEAIRTLCREYGVTRLEIFGSAVTDVEVQKLVSRVRG